MHLPWMSRSERKRWKAARTLSDLGQLAADWWEGSVRHLPGHRASHRPHPTLATVLAAANRAGFLAVAAQVGLTDGPLQQKAAVQGFATDPALIRRLVDAAENAGLAMVLNDFLDAQKGPGDGITVTTCDAQDPNVFGQALGPDDIRAMWPGLPHAVNAVVPALQITLAAPEPGPGSLLWDTLAAAILPAPPGQTPKFVCRECGCTSSYLCGDGCYGVQDQDDGRCQACIDPNVIIDWSKVRDGEENECALCGAPFFSAGRYCTRECEEADADGSDEADDHGAAPAAAVIPGQEPEDPWATSPF
ncbi:DUF6919 domain-containing protein [Streptomyces colonosanans]|uniref:DUF6919 domain-containing protein n=1 Tax=Streptomyces colonosanans TaxID=1428652 RepID=A0A1S2PNP4_9ACTN|nr:hypothetical protein [Streptomyces colonosanans]OIJ95421.1 hypothetical protein BIV24_09065 [Streptomyces colonosanans]